MVKLGGVTSSFHPSSIVKEGDEVAGNGICAWEVGA